MASRRVEYSFLELRDWRDRSTGQLLSLAGVVSVDLDEVNNSITIGVENPSFFGTVRALMADLGVPQAAVRLEIQRPFQPGAEDIRFHPIRPLVGGIAIQTGGVTCTYGFNAQWNGRNVFITNAHCTNTIWNTDQGPVHQGGEYIGYEVYDRAPFECPSSFPGWSSGKCRWSDSSIIQQASGPSFAFGRIVRTQGLGSFTVDPIKPTFLIVGKLGGPAEGQEVHKIGQRTGWTKGRVSRTCFDTGQVGTSVRLLCQDLADYGVGPGDSGSPVFINHGDTVTLVGINWGGEQGIFSAMANVDADAGGPFGTYGPLTVFSSSSGGGGGCISCDVAQ